MKKIIIFFNRKTGLRFHYKVKFTYLSKQGSRIFSFNTNIEITNKSLILDDRRIKRLYQKHIKNSKGVCNGSFDIESMSYLGYFKKDKK